MHQWEKSSKLAVKSQKIEEAYDQRSGCETKQQVLYCFVRSVCMARIEFPTTPIGASLHNGAAPAEHNGFVQPALEGIDIEQPPEIELVQSQDR